MTIRFGSASFFNSPLIYKTPLATKALLGAICLLIATLALAEPRPLRVATSPDNPPLIFQAEGKLVGMEVDLSRLLQAQLGQPLFKAAVEQSGNSHQAQPIGGPPDKHRQ